MSKKLNIAIVGGGIGGAAAALCLMQRGFQARVFERAGSFGEIGAGVQMTPNAVKVLRDLGLYDRLKQVAFQPEAAIARNWKTGRQNFRMSFDDKFIGLYGAPYLQVHRADLLNLLTSELPPDMMTFGRSVVDCRNTETGATLTLDDGSNFDADVVIGADGVRSVIREKIFGDATPRWTGHMCYRGLVPVEGVVKHVGPYNTIWMGPNSHVVTYYVRGGKAINIVAVLNADNWVEEGWSVPATRQELLDSFVGWHPDVVSLFSSVTDTFRWGLFDREPMSSWVRGRVTLIGDSAHPMLPFLSQGAAMALEDAYVLAGALAATPQDPDRALQRYEAERRPRTSRVQLESRRRGETYHLPSAFAQIRRNIEYSIRSVIAPRTGGLKADWIYEYDGTAAIRSFS